MLASGGGPGVHLLPTATNVVQRTRLYGNVSTSSDTDEVLVHVMGRTDAQVDALLNQVSDEHGLQFKARAAEAHRRAVGRQKEAVTQAEGAVAREMQEAMDRTQAAIRAARESRDYVMQRDFDAAIATYFASRQLGSVDSQGANAPAFLQSLAEMQGLRQPNRVPQQPQAFQSTPRLRNP